MDSFKGEKVLVTGITGFIGGHLARSLIERGARVHGISRRTDAPNLTSSIRKAIEIHPLDIRDGNGIARLLREEEYSYVFHLASQADTWQSIQQPYDTIQTNVMGTLNLLEAIRLAPHPPISVFAGSVRVFHFSTHGGKANYSEALHPYDASKVAAEVIVASYLHAYSLPGAVARNTNTYGGNDLNFSRLVPRIMKGIFTEKKIVLRGDGKVRRDFMYVEDAVEGMLALALRAPHLKRMEYTFASGENVSVGDIVEKALALLPRNDITIEWQTEQPLQDRDQVTCDISVTQKELGWRPTHSLTEGLKRTLQWYENHFAHGGEKE
ncbi:MAG: GDP-mannose 4,6-dehydratase [Candidatus Diapherotrites archaeon]|nr:GDP-mannose 4,6-dehydratase [Candidatus Diapherotrites archaeon]